MKIFNTHNLFKSLAIWFVVLLISNHSWAQVWSDGEIESVEIEIVKDRENTVPKANRNFSKIPPRPYEPITPPISYQFKNISFQAPDLNPAIRPLRLKQEELSKIYGNHLKLGFGNYVSPLIDATFNNKRDKQKHYGARLSHHSFGKGPVNDGFSAAGYSGIDLYGRIFGPIVNMGAQVSMDNRYTHFYGFPENFDFNTVEKNDLRQSFNRFSIRTDLSNTAAKKFNYTIGTGFSFLSDNYAAQESEVAVDLNSYYKINDNTRINLTADYFVISRKDELVEAKPRHLFKVSPTVAFTGFDKFKFHVGFNLAIENDSIGKEKAFHLYPVAKATYTLSPSVEVYAGITGNMEKVSLQTLTNQNMWLASNVPVFHTNNSFEFNSGLNGKLGRRAGYAIGASASNYKHLYFFYNQNTSPVNFDVLYDEGTTGLLKLFTEFSFNHSEKFSFLTQARLYRFIVDELDEAWHKPAFEFSSKARYNLFNKLIFNAEYVMLTGITAFDHGASEAITLQSAIDVNLGVEYLVSKKFNVFVQGTNLLNRNYPLFYQYPVRGLQVMAGLGYSF
jgi:hypothetical protein